MKRIGLMHFYLAITAALVCGCAPRFNHTHTESSVAAADTFAIGAFDTASQSGGIASSSHFAVSGVSAGASALSNTSTGTSYVVRGWMYGTQ